MLQLATAVVAAAMAMSAAISAPAAAMLMVAAVLAALATAAVPTPLSVATAAANVVWRPLACCLAPRTAMRPVAAESMTANYTQARSSLVMHDPVYPCRKCRLQLRLESELMLRCAGKAAKLRASLLQAAPVVSGLGPAPKLARRRREVVLFRVSLDRHVAKCCIPLPHTLHRH